MHPTTLDYIPALATHWQISADKMTFPLPHRSRTRAGRDGTPVTADDVVASWKLHDGQAVCRIRLAR